MSPSENDLRAALQRGENEGSEFDVDRVVERGQLHIARRRVRVVSAAAVAVVVGVGTGAYALRGGTDPTGTSLAREHSAAAAGAAGRTVTSDAEAALPRRAADVPRAPVPLRSSAAASAQSGDVACPVPRPRALAPAANGGSTPGSFVDGPVRTLTVCSYGAPTDGGRSPAAFRLTGAAAESLRISLNSASRTNVIVPCPSGSTVRQRLVAIVGVRTDGVATPTVTLILSDPACNVSLTDGRTTRYDWAPDAAFVARVFALAPTAGPGAGGSSAPPRMKGSPPH